MVDDARHDREDGLALYDLLEEQIVPIYYDRDETGLSVEWLRRMKEAIATITPKFSSDRMVRDYTTRFYEPAAADSRHSMADNAAAARELAAWKHKVLAAWPVVKYPSCPAAVANSRSQSGLREISAMHIS